MLVVNTWSQSATERVWTSQTHCSNLPNKGSKSSNLNWLVGVLYFYILWDCPGFMILMVTRWLRSPAVEP